MSGFVFARADAEEAEAAVELVLACAVCVGVGTPNGVDNVRTGLPALALAFCMFGWVDSRTAYIIGAASTGRAVIVAASATMM